MFESWRTRRKETTRRIDVAAKLDELEEKDRAKTKLLEDLEHELHELRSKEKSGITSWFKTKNDPPKDGTSQAPNATPVMDQPLQIPTNRDRLVVASVKSSEDAGTAPAAIPSSASH